MKKLFLLILAGCLLAAAASAQTIPAGTIYVNPTLSNFGFNSVTASNNGDKESSSRFGLSASGGYALMDDIVIVAGAGLQNISYSGASISTISLFAGARYYVIPNVYAGANVTLNSASGKSKTGKKTAVSDDDDDDISFDTSHMTANSLGLQLNAGYTYFLSSKVAVEPSLSYTLGLSTKVMKQSVNLSTFTLNVGFIILL